VIKFRNNSGQEGYSMSDENKNDIELADSGSTDRIGEVGPADSVSEAAFLREQLKVKEVEAKNNYERFLRQTAEIENFKKRALREKEDAIRYANESLVKELLPIVDNLERAVSHSRASGDGGSLVEGVEMVLKGLFDVLSKYGVSQVSAVGQPFNPQLHEAMAHVESDSGAPNTVLEEHQKGYLLKDRLLRPALVTVIKAAKPKDQKNQHSPVENTSTDD
jgi:molecular chaperone GrpE